MISKTSNISVTVSNLTNKKFVNIRGYLKADALKILSINNILNYILKMV